MQELQSKQYIRLLSEYQLFIKVRGYKTPQKTKYTAEVNEFLLWLEKKGEKSVKQITGQLTHQYFNHLISRPKHKKRGESNTLSDNSINKHLFSLALFFEYLLEVQEIKEAVKIPKFLRANTPEKEVLTINQIKLLYKASNTLQEKAILAAGYGCGLRRSEIAALDITDLKLLEGYLVVREGKNSKRREIPLSDSVIKDFREYITKERSSYLHPNQYPKALFINQKGTRMLGDTLNKRFKSILSRVDESVLPNQNYSLHDLRRAIATHLTEAGAGIEFVRDFLGHQDIDTSHLYAIRRKRTTNLKP